MKPLKRRLIVLAVILAAYASAAEVPYPGGYHRDVGIPLAAQIKRTEEKMMANFPGYNKERIIGGVCAPTGGHPFFAGLLIDLVDFPDVQSVCGASLLSVNRLVTAAHCWTDGFIRAWNFNVILGTQLLYGGGQRIQTSQVFLHPEYQTDVHNDIAMIHLPYHAALSSLVQPIALPTVNDLWTDFAGQSANAVGFGRTSDNQPSASTMLSHVHLPVITNQQCVSIAPNWANFITHGTLCTSGAGGVGVCSGDSGGPLTIQRNGQPLLIAVSSFAANGACEQGWPSVFTRVTTFLNFINQHMII